MDREERAAAQESIVLSESDPPSSAVHGPPSSQDPAREFTGEDIPSLSAAPIQEEETAFRQVEEDDDYHPEPLVADSFADASPWQPDTFAELTEPCPVPALVPIETTESLKTALAAAPQLAEIETEAPAPVATSPTATEPQSRPPVAITDTPPRPVFSSSFKPPSQPLPAQRPPTAPLAGPFIAASAIPGIEPLPCWNEISERRPQPLPSPSKPLAAFPFVASSAPPADLAAPPTTVGVNLESLFDTPALEDNTALSDEIPTSKETRELPVDSPSIPLFTTAPQALSSPPVVHEEESAAPPSVSSPWHAPANTPIFADTSPVLAPPSPWVPTASTSPLKPSPAPPSEDRMEEFFSALKTTPAPSPEVRESDTAPSLSNTTPVPEISVQVAAAGEAWFDSPLAAADVPNPWLPPKGDVEGSDVPLTSSFAPLTPSSPSTAPLVDAEVVLRPRAPTQASVVAKNPPTKPAMVNPPEADQSPEDPSQPNEPAQSPREQRARAAWRSWWKVD